VESGVRGFSLASLATQNFAVRRTFRLTSRAGDRKRLTFVVAGCHRPPHPRLGRVTSPRLSFGILSELGVFRDPDWRGRRNLTGRLASHAPACLPVIGKLGLAALSSPALSMWELRDARVPFDRSRGERSRYLSGSMITGN